MLKKVHKNNILVAPLDWGLGHTTRCLLIIKCLQSNGYNVFVAANTTQKQLIQTQLKSNVKFLELEGYNIKYSKTKWSLPFKIAFQVPKILFKIYKEHVWLKKQIKEYKLHAVISDNRYGLFNKAISCVFITHQLQILAPSNWMMGILRKINYFFINKYNALFIPDVQEQPSAAGKLSHPKKKPSIKTVYLGLLNRFYENEVNPIEIKDNEIDICVLLSGPEPQRTILEDKILGQIQHIKSHKMVVLRGLPSSSEQINLNNQNLKIYNHLSQQTLYNLLLSSKIVVARSGYTTLMELLPMYKKLILIPTPGQTEQEYLAKHLANQHLAMYTNQENVDVVALIKAVETFEPLKQTFRQFDKLLFLEEIEKLLN